MALMVIDVVTVSSGMSRKSVSMSSIEQIETPTLPTSPSAIVVVGVVADLRRQVEGDGDAGLALLEQVLVAAVRLLGVGEAGVLAHGPETAAIHRWLYAAGEGILAGEGEVVDVLEAVAVIRRVERAHRFTGRRLERDVALDGRLLSVRVRHKGSLRTRREGGNAAP